MSSFFTLMTIALLSLATTNEDLVITSKEYTPSINLSSVEDNVSLDLFIDDYDYAIEDSDSLDSSQYLLESKGTASSTNHYSNLIALKNCGLSAGNYVYTDGYYNSGDGGAAKYYITSTSEAADNLLIIQLKNGLKAKLICGSELDVAQIGILPNNVISDKINTVQKRAESYGIKTIKFNDGLYLINKPIALKSLNYIGTGKTNLCVSTKFQAVGDKILYTLPDSTHSSYTLSFSNLNFLFPAVKNHPQSGKEMLLVALQETNKCTITNCNFKAYPDNTNGTYMDVVLLWFKHSSLTKDVIINNCTFSNTTGDGYSGSKTDHLRGGCFWICGQSNSYTSPVENVKISNCSFYSTVTDENIALWRGAFKDISFDHCTFTNATQDCDNSITFYNGSFKNISITNSVFNIYAPAQYIVKITRLANESDFTFSGSSFNLATGSTDSSKRQVAIFSTSEDMAGASQNIPCSVGISDCKFISQKNTHYRTIVGFSNVNNKHYSLKKCEMLLPLDYGVFTISGNNSSISLDDSKIDTQTYLSTIENSSNFTVSISNNEIYSLPKSVFKGNMKINYVFRNNICTSTSAAALLTCIDVASNSSIVYNNADNTFSTGSKLREFYSNNGLLASDILVKE